MDTLVLPAVSRRSLIAVRKVSPREVDDDLMDHPAVLQVVTFAVPHDKLGEDIAAAAVLREGATATEGELGSFLSERLAAFKTPRKILLLAEIPKGATGKLQRIGLAQKLGLCRFLTSRRAREACLNNCYA